ncbi:hypothetical protein AYI68_g7899 [Smittium mucronatum]|uniref:Uncharacterized protein n=1 Tax=Smittium mucronatum TaxID=133383 RepID=A0A1R0GMG3_9FUNG|nr:hypothetical protein AYI68_g7899 [Smittium mucronatum]
MPLILLGGLVQPLLLPPLESARPNDWEGETGATENLPDHASLENCEMVPDPPKITYKPSTASTRKNS